MLSAAAAASTAAIAAAAAAAATAAAATAFFSASFSACDCIRPIGAALLLLAVSGRVDQEGRVAAQQQRELEQLFGHVHRAVAKAARRHAPRLIELGPHLHARMHMPTRNPKYTQGIEDMHTREHEDAHEESRLHTRVHMRRYTPASKRHA